MDAKRHSPPHGSIDTDVYPGAVYGELHGAWALRACGVASRARRKGYTKIEVGGQCYPPLHKHKLRSQKWLNLNVLSPLVRVTGC